SCSSASISCSSGAPPARRRGGGSCACASSTTAIRPRSGVRSSGLSASSSRSSPSSRDTSRCSSTHGAAACRTTWRGPRSCASRCRATPTRQPNALPHPKRTMPRYALGRHPPCTSERRRRLMAIGPVQLIVLGFDHPNFHGEVIAELERLRESDMVKVIDSLVVYKDADGELEVEHLSNLTRDQAIELGSKIGALIGLGIEGEEGMEAGAEAGAEEAAGGGINVFGDREQWEGLEDIPND